MMILSRKSIDIRSAYHRLSLDQVFSQWDLHFSWFARLLIGYDWFPASEYLLHISAQFLSQLYEI